MGRANSLRQSADFTSVATAIVSCSNMKMLAQATRTGAPENAIIIYLAVQSTTVITDHRTRVGRNQGFHDNM